MTEVEYWKYIRNKYRMIDSQYQRFEEFCGKRNNEEQITPAGYIINESKSNTVRAILGGLG